MKKNFLFLGFAIPDEKAQLNFKRDKNAFVQTHKFNWNFIKGIEYYDDFNYTYISADLVNDYPIFPEKRISKDSWIVRLDGKSIEITGIPFINTSILKIITRFISSFYYSLKKYHKVKEKAGVMVYSVHVPFMLTGYIISRIYNIDYITIWTDPPSISSEFESGLKSKLRKVELNLSKYLMNKATKVIALTKYLAEDFAPGKPYLVIEGVVDEKDLGEEKQSDIDESSNLTRVVYTGALAKMYGVNNIVEAFMLIENKNIVLDLYGRGDYEDELKSIAKNNKNICYKGFISNEEILKVQRKADFLINARSAEDEYVKYSFPSKTLEYMMSGTPLITTMLPGIPEEYRDYLIILEDNDPKTICRELEKVTKLDRESKNKIGVRALNFARTKNYTNQGKRIIEFLKQ